MGFGVPLASWFRGPLKQQVEDSLLGERMLGSGFFNADTLAKIVKQHQQGAIDHSTTIWSLLMFDSFLRNN